MKKLPGNLGAKRRVFQKYKKRARESNILFKLSMESFIKLTQENCFYCGIEPSNKLESRDYYTSVNGEKRTYYYNDPFLYNGIDRLDNSKGYLKTNVVACCAICNRAKYRMSTKEFFSWITRLVEHVKN